MPYIPKDALRQYTRSTGEGGGGGGEQCKITKTDAVPTNHGGLEAGAVIAGQNACQVLEKILFPYEYPQFTSFYIENQSTTLEIGDKVTGGTRNFIWDTTHDENIQANSIAIKDLTTNTELASGLANDGSEQLDIGGDIVNTSPNSTHVWRISATNTKNETFGRNFTVAWRARVYWGSTANENPDESEINSKYSAL